MHRTEHSARSAAHPTELSWQRGVVGLLRGKPLGVFGALIILVMLVLAIFAESIAPFHYNQVSAGDRLEPPSFTHLLGTDNLGRDIFSRIVYGARVSMSISLGAVLIGTVLGTVVGISSGYFGGTFDILIQRVVDAWMAFPWLVIVLSVMSVLGPSIPHLTLALSVLVATNGSRLIRSATLSVKEQTYIESAQAVGAAHGRTLQRYIVPNVMAPIIVTATISLGSVILAEAALSFLGFGVPSPYPSWGRMLNSSGREYMIRAPWMVIWAGVAISLTVFAFNMLGDALRDMLDPRMRGTQR